MQYLTSDRPRFGGASLLGSILGIVLSLGVVGFVGLHRPKPVVAPTPIPTETTSFASIESPVQAAALPVRLRIPAIGVSASLETVGLTKGGDVDVPKNPIHAAWFDKGPLPGASGNAVIDGHYGWWENGTAAVFNNLSQLKKGDVVYVDDANGHTLAFTVQRLQNYGENEKASDVFIASDGRPHLNLITCTGVWNAAQQSYSKRLVVFTDEVGE